MLITPESVLLGSHLCKKRNVPLYPTVLPNAFYISRYTCIMIPTAPVNVIISTCGEKGNLVVSCQSVSTEKVHPQQY